MYRVDCSYLCSCPKYKNYEFQCDKYVFVKMKVNYGFVVIIFNLHNATNYNDTISMLIQSFVLCLRSRHKVCARLVCTFSICLFELLLFFYFSWPSTSVYKQYYHLVWHLSKHWSPIAMVWSLGSGQTTFTQTTATDSSIKQHRSATTKRRGTNGIKRRNRKPQQNQWLNTINRYAIVSCIRS